MNTSIITDTTFEICQVNPPLVREAAWEIESLLLKIFEYGDYSFRSALRGEYSETLTSTFFLAKHKAKAAGAAGCLYAHKNPAISVVGPVGVLTEYQSSGIGTKLVTSLINYLTSRGCMAVYLGVSPTTSARGFFETLGFEKYKGIIMRRLSCTETEFEETYFGKCNDIAIRRAKWGNLPGVQALASFPCKMYTFDFRRSIFSSKYVEPTEFLSVFPEMMKAFDKLGGFANVLVTRNNENVVGLAHISRLRGKAQQHIAELDFYVHDNFIEHAKLLVSTTVEESKSLSIGKINCHCLACDHVKRNVIEALGVRQIAVLPEYARVNGSCEDVLVYELGGPINAIH